MKCSYLTNNHSSCHEDYETDDEADAALGNLRDGLSVRKNEDGDGEEKLNGLEDVDAVSSPATVYSKEAVCVTLHWISVRVQGHIHFPELESRAMLVSEESAWSILENLLHGKAAENSVESNTRAVAHLSKCPSKPSQK